MAQACDLCGEAHSDVAAACLSVVRQRVYPGTVVSGWVSLRCQCCDGCVGKAQRIKHRRYLVVAGMVAWLFLAPCLLSPLGLLLGEKGSAQNFVILGGGLGIVVAGFLGGPLYLCGYNRRATARLLGPVIDKQLRALARIRSWGLLNEVLIIKDTLMNESAEIVTESLPS
jgi:hypothetical protein